MGNDGLHLAATAFNEHIVRMAPNAIEIERQCRQALNAICAPAIAAMARLTLRQFEHHMNEIIETELANRNIEYAQALTDYAQ